MDVSFDKAEAAYGSLKAFARRLGVKYTTVHGWKRSGNVPYWRAEKIEAIALEDGKDLFSPPLKKRTRG